jgi:hypothetical protein
MGILTDQTLPLEKKRVVVRALSQKMNPVWTRIHLEAFQLKLPFFS